MTQVYAILNGPGWFFCAMLALAISLSGCGAVSSLVETSKKMTAKLTGADDPNNTSALAQAGRMQNAGTDAVAGVAGVKSDAAPATTQPAPGSAPATSAAVAQPQEASNPSQGAPVEAMSIAEMQKILLGLGYQPGPADGASGKRTVEALKKFQQANKLPATGTLDADTIRSLRRARSGS